MIPIQRLPLQTATDAQLTLWQQEIDTIAEYPLRVDKGQRRFKSRNRPNNTTFIDVRSRLSEMCCGAQRCQYCEDSAAFQIDHIWPQNVYPSLVFVWENYLYACGHCNTTKRDRFEIYAKGTGRRINVAPANPKKGRLRPPPDGTALLIDPTIEDPFDFLMLDLLSGRFLPLSTRRDQRWHRADFTIKLLGLNSRSYLMDARKDACNTYCRYLGDYIRCRDEGEPQAELDRLRDELMRLPHPTVWREMKRQWQDYALLRSLFGRAPETLHW